MPNGDRANGISFIPLRDVASWEHDLIGKSATSIDAYATTNPAECFAVLTKYSFSTPEPFAPRFPALWQCFYLLSPGPLLVLTGRRNRKRL